MFGNVSTDSNALKQPFQQKNEVITRRRVLQYYILLLSLALLPLIKVFFPFRTLFDAGPFENVDRMVRIPEDMVMLVKPMKDMPWSIYHNLKVLVMVNSRKDEYNLRQEIRRSWAKLNKHWDSIAVVFVLAKPKNNKELYLLEEANIHMDLLVLDVEEDYYSLSLKTYAMLYYQSKYLPDIKCLIKADSDNVLNLRNYELLCEETKAPAIIGNCDVDRTVIRTNSKWAVPYELYNEKYWPKYCSTGTYVFCGKDVPQRIIEAAKKTPFFTSVNYRLLPEDVLFTGLFAEIAKLPKKTVVGMNFFDHPIYSCRETKHTYSIHMHRKKEPARYYKRLRSLEGEKCNALSFNYLLDLMYI